MLPGSITEVVALISKGTEAGASRRKRPAAIIASATGRARVDWRSDSSAY